MRRYRLPPSTTLRECGLEPPGKNGNVLQTRDCEATMTDAVTQFTLNVPEQTLDDLRARLARTRWPDRELVPDWSQGAPLARVEALCDYWANGYDWRRCEAQLNASGQFRTTIDGLGLHFLHVPSPNPDAIPLLLTHGWP